MEEPEAEDKHEVLMDEQDSERYRVGGDGDHLTGVPVRPLSLPEYESKRSDVAELKGREDA